VKSLYGEARSRLLEESNIQLVLTPVIIFGGIHGDFGIYLRFLA
jgi:hypothetical protein